MGQSFKRTTALSLSAIMTVNLCTVGLSRPAFAVEPNLDDAARIQKMSLSDIEGKSRFTLNVSNPYMNRLRIDISGDPQLQIGFNEADSQTGDILMDSQDAHNFLEKAKIQINDGDIWTFKDAQITLANFGNGESNSSFETSNKEFIRQFIEADELKVAIEDFEGNLVEATIKNKIDEDERAKFIEEFDSNSSTSADKANLLSSIEKAGLVDRNLYTTESLAVLDNMLSAANKVNANSSASQEEVDTAASNLDNALAHLVKNEELAIVGAGFDKEHSEWSEKWGITFNQDAQVFDAMVNADEVLSIEINSVKFEGKDAIKKVFRTTGTAQNLYLADQDAQDAFKKAGKESPSHVVISLSDGNTLTFGSKDTSKPDSEDTTPEVKPEVTNDSFNTIKAMLVHHKNQNSESMSGATMEHSAYMLRDEKGVNTVVLYFKPAVINGILAYATDLTVEGELSHKFILTEDNSAVCIVKLPEFEGDEKIFDAHIYSSVMDSEVGLKIENIAKTSDVSTALKNKVAEAQMILDQNEYFPKTEDALKSAIKNANKNDVDRVAAYASLVECIANLREKLADPFVGDELFFVSARDTSIVGGALLQPYVRVDVDSSGKKTFTGIYDAANQWWGLSSIETISIYTDDARTQEIPVEITPLENNKLKFSFSVSAKDLPASGVFKAKIKEVGSDRVMPTDIVLDYATIKKGPQKQMLQDAIKEALSYQKNDYSGTADLNDKKDEYTKTSWNRLMDTIESCRDDLKTEMTQDEIDSDIKDVLDAKASLVLVKAAGRANTANVSTQALNNPENYYVDADEHTEYADSVGWLGSRIVFGEQGNIYRVLNNGTTQVGGAQINTNKILIMAENERVKAPFTADKATSLKDAVRWDKSQVRNYLNNEYLNDNFTKIQKDVILDSTITTSFVPERYETETLEDIVTTDKIFAPSNEMMRSYSYGYASNDARVCDDSYGLRNITRDGSGEILIVGIKPKGRVEASFLNNSDKYQTAPCMNIDATKVLMTIDANSLDEVSIKPSNSIETNLWKLVLLDDSLTLSNVKTTCDKSHVSFTADSNAKEYMVAICEGESFEKGEIKSFGKVDPKGFELPESFDAKTQKVYLMAINNDKGSVSATAPYLMDINQDASDTNTDADTTNPSNPAVKQVGSVDVVMLKDDSLSKSMANDMFSKKADVEIKGDSATLKLYVAYPIPAFKDQGKQGTVTDFKIRYNGVDYMGAIDITSDAKMKVKRNNKTFGLVKGEEIPAETIVFQLPKSAIYQDKLDANCMVNVVMMSDADFDIKLENLDLHEEVDSQDTLSAHKILVNNLSDAGRIVFDADANKFRVSGEIFVDGTKLDKSSYNVTNGSTIITLMKSFVEGLTPGEHVLTARFNDGTPDVSASFKTKAGNGGAQAGDNTDVLDTPTSTPGASTGTGSSAGSKVSALNFSKLEDGTYSVIADMLKPNKKESMANKALDHNVKLEVKDGKYYAIATFKGIKVGAKMGYLGDIKYADDSGNLKNAEVIKSITIDGKTYPQTVRIPLSKSAISTGLQKLQIFVQTMEDIAEGSGTQDVYMRFDGATVKKGFSPKNSFYGTMAETKGQRLAQTSDGTYASAQIATMLIAGAASIALSQKKFKEQ